MKTRRILLLTFFFFLAARIILIIFNIHFTSVYGGQLFFFFLSLVGLAAWLLHLDDAKSRIILGISAFGAYVLLYFFVSFFNRLLIDGERRPESFRNTDKVVSRQFGFGIGSGPYIVIGMGETYLGGLLYREDLSFTIESEGPPPVPEAYEIPESLKDPESCDCWFLEERGWLFDFDTKTLYRLKKQ